jgi:hypothetical protein
MQIYPVECLFADQGKADHLGNAPSARVFTACNHGDIVPSDQAGVHLPAAKPRQSGELIGRITFQTRCRSAKSFFFPAAPKISVRSLTDPY